MKMTQNKELLAGIILDPDSRTVSIIIRQPVSKTIKLSYRSFVCEFIYRSLSGKLTGDLYDRMSRIKDVICFNTIPREYQSWVELACKRLREDGYKIDPIDDWDQEAEDKEWMERQIDDVINYLEKEYNG